MAYTIKNKVKKEVQHRTFNKYYVIDSSDSDVLGTNPTFEQIQKTKILYTGTNPKIANRVYREYNSGKSKFAENHASIYAGVNKTDKIVLHKY